MVSKPVDVVVDYLKDFANAEQWDPGTKSCTQETPGPVGVGTTWHNVSEIKGHETELAYRLEELSPSHIKFIGEIRKPMAHSRPWLWRKNEVEEWCAGNKFVSVPRCRFGALPL